MPKLSPSFDQWTYAYLDDVEKLLENVHVDRYALAVWQIDRPQPDELLAAKGIDTSHITSWCEHASDDLHANLAQALRSGFAVFGPDESAPAAIAHEKGLHTLIITVPESIADGRWWYLQLSRSESAGPFDDGQIRRAKLILRHWQSGFHQTQEPISGRMLLGHDDRLLLADLFTQARILDRPDALQRFLDQIKPIREQRFPDMTDHMPKNFILEFTHQPLWVSMCRRHPVAPVAAVAAVTPDNTPQSDRIASESSQWCIELRTLEEANLPALGRLEDDRIAQAVAYLHDNFSDSPNLNDVSAAVHMSPFHFHRLFSRMVGLSPKHYLQRLQLQVARWMLHAGNEPIGNVASRTGFASHGHFTSTFHRRVGESPSDYRIRIRAGRGNNAFDAMTISGNDNTNPTNGNRQSKGASLLTNCMLITQLLCA